MTTIAPHRSRPNVDQIIRIHSQSTENQWAGGDGTEGDPSAARAGRRADMVAEFTGAVLDLLEVHAGEIEPLIAKLVRFSSSAILAGSLTHVDEFLDDLYTMSSSGMTTGDADIDELLVTAFRRH